MPTILVVDDMAIFREPIEAVLRAEGFQVFSASDGAEALRQIAERRPDLVLLDLGMPVLDGLSALRRLRADPALKHTRVIVLSAETERAQVEDAVRLGVAGYLLKSEFSLRSMLGRVKRVLSEGGTASAAEKPIGARADEAGASAHSTPATRSVGGGGAPVPTAARARKSSASGPDRGTASTAVDLSAGGPLLTRSELFKRINADGELSGFSPTVTQVLSITADERCSMEQVAKAVSQDHTVALKILKLANSCVYCRGDRVDTVQKAVQRIGTRSIRQAVLNIGVVERFGSLAFEKHLSTPLFWEHSIACGMIAAEIAHALGHKEPDAAFTAGLLHDLGRILFADRLGETYVQVIDAALAAGAPLEKAEAALLQSNHASAMERVLQGWRFPKDLVNPIVLHHSTQAEVRTKAPQQVVDTTRLILADRLAHAMMLGSSGNDTIYPTEDACRLLGVGPGTIQRIEETARQQTDETKFALLSQGAGAPWPRVADERRAALSGAFRPLYISAEPELDAYRVFCDQLAEGAGEAGAPNLAVAHIVSARESATISERLLRAEREAGVQGLPLLTLSPASGILLEESATAGRAHTTLATPTPISCLIASINDLLSAHPVRSAA